MGLTGIDELVFDFFDFFEYMQVWWLFTIKIFIFFEYMQVLCTLGIKMLIFLSICRFGEPQVSQTCIYSKKSKILIGKRHQTCIYSKKSKHLIVKSHQTCIYSKKSKKIKNFRLYVGLTGTDELVFDFFDFFEYMQVWWLFTIKIFDFFEYMQVLCTLGIKMLIFLSICRFGELQVLKPAYTQKISKQLIVKSHQTCIYSKK